MNITEHAWLLAAVPAGFFVMLALIGRYLPRQGDFIGVISIGTAFVLMLFVVANFLQHRGGLGPYVNDMEWSTVGDLPLRMGIFVDPITVVMFIVVTTVALMVNIFSIGYMK